MKMVQMVMLQLQILVMVREISDKIAVRRYDANLKMVSPSFSILKRMHKEKFPFRVVSL
jgi:hypothetical protein